MEQGYFGSTNHIRKLHRHRHFIREFRFLRLEFDNFHDESIRDQLSEPPKGSFERHRFSKDWRTAFHLLNQLIRGRFNGQVCVIAA